MKEIIVTNQAELDALPIDFDGRIIVKFGTPYNRAIVNRRFRYSVVARENSSVVAWENSSVVAWGNTQVVDSTKTHEITTSGNSRIVYNPRNINEYLDHYGITHVDGKVKLYKAVHKRGDRYFSDNDSCFEYIIGRESIADGLTTDTSKDCGQGIHIAYKEWALDYGAGWNDLAIIEVEAVMEQIVVPVSGCGKVRVDRVTTVREVPLEECGLRGKLLAKRKASR